VAGVHEWARPGAQRAPAAALPAGPPPRARGPPPPARAKRSWRGRAALEGVSSLPRPALAALVRVPPRAMAALLAALLVAACAARGACAQAAAGTVSSLAELQAAVTAGGAWTVVANLTLAGALTFSGGVPLSLTGDVDACGGLCWLDAAFVGGHFVVAPGATLQLRGLKLVQAVRGYDNACAPTALRPTHGPRGCGHAGAACGVRHARAHAHTAQQRHRARAHAGVHEPQYASCGARGWRRRASLRVLTLVARRRVPRACPPPGGGPFPPLSSRAGTPPPSRASQARCWPSRGTRRPAPPGLTMPPSISEISHRAPTTAAPSSSPPMRPSPYPTACWATTSATALACTLGGCVRRPRCVCTSALTS
jgi:hypothetical protein